MSHLRKEPAGQSPGAAAPLGRAYRRVRMSAVLRLLKEGGVEPPAPGRAVRPAAVAEVCMNSR